MTDALRFPKNFVWGVATSAHQFEGGLDDNNWGAWERRGRIHSGERSGLACDWWRNAERDFDLAREMGLNALRLSVEWSRVEPRENEWNDAALARYREMLEGLVARGITPWVCLHHFTNPAWFELRGGFEDPASPVLFERFARRVVDALGDICRFWVTLNEPNVYAVMGYQLGEFPPGRRGDTRAFVRVTRNLVRAHAHAYRALHAARSGLVVGFTQNFFLFEPFVARSPLDRIVSHIPDVAFNQAFVHALQTGQLPFPFSALAKPLRDVQGTYDFAGYNYYGRFRVTFDAKNPSEFFSRRFVPEDAPQGDTGHHSPYAECYPHGIAIFARRIAAMGKPIYILENGVPDARDRLRPWLIAHAAREMFDLIAAGVDLRGYFHWSLVDNFEWTEGWQLRFGLIAMDERTQQRTLRNSGRLYGAIARKNALERADVETWAPSAVAEVFPVPT